MALRSAHGRAVDLGSDERSSPAADAGPLTLPATPEALPVYRLWVEALSAVYGPPSSGVFATLAGLADQLVGVARLRAGGHLRAAARIERSTRRGFVTAVRLAQMEARHGAP